MSRSLSLGALLQPRVRARALAAAALVLAVACGGAARESATPAASIAIDPVSGSGNTQVSVRGRDFPPGARVELHLAVPLTGSTPGSFSAADVAADGQFETAFVMPSAWPNGSSIDEPDLEVVAITADGTVSASARFAFDPAGAITQRYQPLAIAECDPLRDAIESALAAGTTTRAVQPFATASGSIGGEGCVLLVHGDGGDLDGFVPTAMAMRDVLLAHGWSEDLAFAAGGPTGLEWRSGSMTA